MKALAKIPLVLISAFAVFILAVMMIGLFNHFGLHVRYLLAGVDYLPPLWLLAMTLPVCAAFWILRRRRPALILLGGVLAFFILFDDLSLRFMAAPRPVRNREYEQLDVIAYNVRYYSHGIDSLASYFRRSGADVLLLSESVLDSVKTEYLRKAMAGYTLITDHGRDTAILSRYPMTTTRVVPLPSVRASLSGRNDLEKLVRSPERRAFVHAVINVKGVPVNVLSVRLIAGRAKDKSLQENWRWGRYLLRTQQQEQQAILDYISGLDGPVVFGGDLNAPPSARVIRKFRSFARDAYLSDHIFGRFTFRTRFPTMRLDYVFCSPDLIPVRSEIVNLRLSDHFPIYCRFAVPKSRTLAAK